jgi:hypothetical protein
LLHELILKYWLVEVNFMSPIIKYIIAVVIGVVVGSGVNMGLVNIGPSIIPLPEGADVSTMEGLAESMSLFSPANFLFPFLAHALGTLVAAFVAAKVAGKHELRFGILFGVLFLMGGITAANMFGGPIWFLATDLILAYLPMGILGAKLAAGSKRTD